MSNTMKGLVSAFVATLVVSGLILLKGSLNVAPEFGLVRLLTRLGGISTVQAWMDHFIIGTIIWGLLYSALELLTNKGHHLLKGLAFGVFAWLVMMLFFMPIVSGGLFGEKFGYMAAVVTFLYHMAYGAVLGLTFAVLSAWVPEKAPESSPQKT